MADRVAVVLDGGFVKKKLIEKNKHFPTPAEVVDLVKVAMAHPRLSGCELFRVYWYDAPPYEGWVVNPLSRVRANLGQTIQAKQNKALIDTLELEPDFAVRRGELLYSGWELGRRAFRDLMRTPRNIVAGDLVPSISQKGVDTRIGLDLATTALKRSAQTMLLVTGDSDFVPVMKFVRAEGIRVFLETMGHPVKRELRAHADFVM